MTPVSCKDGLMLNGRWFQASRLFSIPWIPCLLETRQDMKVKPHSYPTETPVILSFSILLYGCESGVLTQKLEDYIHSYATNCYRIILGFAIRTESPMRQFTRGQPSSHSHIWFENGNREGLDVTNPSLGNQTVSSLTSMFSMPTYMSQEERDDKETYTTSTLPIASTRQTPFHQLRLGMLLWIEITGGSLWPTTSQPNNQRLIWRH